MLRPYIQATILLFALITNSDSLICKAEDFRLAKVEIQENSGIHRDLEYVVCSLQLPIREVENSDVQIVAVDINNSEKIPCQIFNRRTFKEENITLIQVIFPVTIDAYKKKNYVLKRTTQANSIPTDLSHQGKGLEIIVDNEFYRADLTKSDQSEAKSHTSGQLRELFLKMGFDIRLFRTENRMHWAPNFQNVDYTDYETIAGWENPENYYLLYLQKQTLVHLHPSKYQH